MISAYVPDLARLREAIVARVSLNLADFGIDDDPETFVDSLVDCMAEMYPAYNVDNLLVRPREAIRFCDAVRQRKGAYDLPDDIILQPLLNRRKRG